MTRCAVLILLSLSFAPFGEAQKPKTTNAQRQEVSAAGGLQATFNSLLQKQETPAWIGYMIPTAPKERTMCCFDSRNRSGGNGDKCCMGCKLESNEGGSFDGSVSRLRAS